MNERENLTYNLQIVIDKLQYTKAKIAQECEIALVTLDRYFKQECTPRDSTLESLKEFYNAHCVPSMDDCRDWLNKRFDASTIRLKEDSEENNPLTRYMGEYYVYYLSGHYENVVHGGKIKVYKDGRARMLIGLQDRNQLEHPAVGSIFETSSAEAAVEEFKAYKKFLDKNEARIKQRCYLYEGAIEKVDDYTVQINFRGVEQHQTHKQTFVLNTKRQPTRVRQGDYSGGIALVLATPNKAHPQIRTYRVGISTFPMMLDDPMIQKLLWLPVNEFGRSIVDDDDRKWFDLILRREQEAKQKC